MITLSNFLEGFMKSTKGIFSTATAAISIFNANARIQMHTETLDNGLKVIVIPTKTKNIAQFAIVYKVGCAYDKLTVVGISHFLEHMMFKGTKKLSGKDLNKLITMYMLYVNAFTSEDITAYWSVLKPDLLPLALAIEADRMQNLLLKQEDIASEQKVVADERNMRVDASAKTRFIQDAFLKSIYLYSNYGVNAIGYPFHIANYNQKELKLQYDKYYTPDNAYVVCVGDVKPDDVIKNVNDYFGNIKKHCGEKQKRVVDPPKTGLRFYIDHTSSQIATKQLTILYTFSRKNVDTLRQFMMLKIVVQALCGNRRSVLYRKFVDNEQKLYSINGELEVKEIDKVILHIDAVLHNELNRADVEKQIYSAIDRFVTNDFTEDLFKKVKATVVRSFVLLNDNPGDLLFSAIEHITLGYEKEFGDIAEITESITYDEIVSYAKSILSTSHRTHVLYSHPEEKAKPKPSSIKRSQINVKHM